MFINSKKAYEFPFPDNPEKTYTIPAAYIGPVPDWVTETRLFGLAVQEHSITMVGHETSIPAAPAVSAEELELRERANNLGIEHADELPLMELAVLVYQGESAMDDDEEGGELPNGNSSDLVKQLETMDADALRAYAAQNNIALGNATSENGMRKKILDTLN